jgi:hypothetical protein
MALIELTCRMSNTLGDPVEIRSARLGARSGIALRCSGCLGLGRGSHSANTGSKNISASAAAYDVS